MATTPPDQSRFIQDITIRNFKCFEELKIEGCGQFNLILGDNNVGKTSVLEALLVDGEWNEETAVIARLQRVRLDKYGADPRQVATDPEPLIGLVESFSRDGDGIRGFSIKLARRNLPDWPAFIVQTKAVRELDEASRAIVREFRVRSQVVIWTKHGEEHIGGFIAPSEPLYTGINLPYLSTKSFYGRDLVKYFSDAVAPSAEIKSQFVKALCHLIPNLRDVEILLDPVLDSQIVARLHDQDRAQALAFFGDGAVKLARILIQMPMRQGAHLMIDEIDAGIHYSRFTTLWRTTLLAAIANNVQLFITTHNNECLQALARVLETEEFAPYRAECRAFTLRRLPDGSTKAYRRDFEHAMENDYEIRGGQL